MNIPLTNIMSYILGASVSYIILYFINTKLELQKYIINRKHKFITLIICSVFCFSCANGFDKLNIGMTIHGHILTGLLFGVFLFTINILDLTKIK